MGVIFLFSTALFSGTGTGSFLDAVLSLIYPGLTEDTLWLINWLMRKAAHVTEYAILAVLWIRALVIARGTPPGRAMLAAFIVSALYAITDEAHQHFVPERDGSPYDVLLDWVGAGAGLVFMAIFKTGRRRV